MTVRTSSLRISRHAVLVYSSKKNVDKQVICSASSVVVDVVPVYYY